MAGNHKAKKAPTPAAVDDILESEKWRLINESGVLNKAAAVKSPQTSTSTTTEATSEEDTEKDDENPLAEEIFQAVTLIIPFSFLLFMMELLIHYQYGQPPVFLDIILNRMIPSVPILSLFIFYTSRYKQARWLQLALFALSCAVGPRMIWLVNLGNWLQNMQQCPPLATVWVYCIVQLELLPACINIVLAGAYMRWNKFTLFT